MNRLVLLAVLVITSCAPAAELSTTDDALAERFQRQLDSLWEQAQATDEVFPGATVAYVLADGELHGFATGYSDVEQQVEMRSDMRMPSGSIGKTYVAAVALSLAHEGIVDLDAPISDVVGAQDWFPRLPNAADITLRILLNHSSGMVDHAFDVPEFGEAAAALVQSDDPDATLTPRELLEFALDREPLFAAGTGYSYTDTGYILAGMVMDAAAESAYYEELRRRVLEPLNLGFTLPQDRRRVPDLAQGYAVAGAQLFGVAERVVADGAMVFNPALEWTGGGLYNNPQDLVRWGKALYEGSAFDFPYVDELLGSAAIGAFEDPGDVYALGVRINSDEVGKRYGHGGFFPGYNSILSYYPEHGIAVAMQINTDQSRVDAHARALARIVVENSETANVLH